MTAIPIPVTTDGRRLIKETTSRCPVCQIQCPGKVVEIGDSVFMERTCPIHGFASYRIAPARLFYYYALGEQEKGSSCCGSGSCCSADGKDTGTLGANAFMPTDNTEKLATCTALIDIVDSCNLPCPTCYAGSPIGVGENLKYTPYDEVVMRIQRVLDRKGKIELLQLSGGEPTLHPEFFRILEWAFENPGIDHVLVNTNGVKLAHDAAFLDEFKKVFRPKQMRLYLQFDGPQEAGQVTLRGADMRKTRVRAIENAASFNLAVHLAMTVNNENYPHLWEALKFGAQFKNVLGISFQPMFLSGRSPGNVDDVAITAGDVALGLIDQSNGGLIAEDFTPLPCGDPNCQIVSGVGRFDGELVPVLRYVTRSEIPKILHNKINFDIEALKSCGCDDQFIAELLKNAVLKPENGFFIFIKKFMDVRDWDKHRTDRCCTHVITPSGGLASFCRYYSGFPDTKARVEGRTPLPVVS